MNLNEFEQIIQQIKSNFSILNNIPEDYLQPKEIRNNLTGAFYSALKPTHKRNCIFAGCSEPAIDSHSIQNALLKKIANSKKKVLHFGFDISHLELKKAIKEIPVTEASTFLGFCNKHDTDIFLPIEQSERSLLVTDSEQMFLLTYRAICREYVKSKEAENSIKKFIAKIDKPENLNDYAQLFAIINAYNSYCEFFWIEKIKKMSDVLYQNNVYDNFFQYGYAKIDKEIPLYAESFFAVQGATEDIIYKKDIKKEMPLYCAITLIPKDGCTEVFYSVAKEQEHELKAFLKRFNTTGRDLECFITDVILRNCDNFYMSEDFWNSIPDNDKKRFMNHYYKTITDREYDVYNTLNLFTFI